MFSFRLLVVLLTGSLALPAQGRDQRCAPTVEAWLNAWSQEQQVAVDAARCPTDADLVILTIRTDADGPFTMEIMGQPDRAYQRINDRLGLSPVANVSDYQEIASSHRRAFEGLTDWLRAHPDDVVFDNAPEPPPDANDEVVEEDLVPTFVGTPPYSRLGWLGPWLGLAALLALAAALWLGRGLLAVAWWQVAGVALVSLVARLALGFWGPLHTNFQGAVWVETAYNPTISEWYGPGYAELLHWLARLFDYAPDYAIFAAVGLLSALTPVAVLLVLRTARVPLLPSIVAAGLLALEPVSVRISTTEGYLPLLTALNAGLVLVEVLAVQARIARRWWLASTALLAAALLAAQIVRIHPVGWVPMVLTIPVAATLVRADWRSWFGALGYLAATIGAASLASYGDRALLNAAMIQFGTGTRFALDNYIPVWLPWTVGIVALAGFGLPMVRKLRPLARHIVLLALVLLVMLITREQYGQSSLWQASYDRLFVVPAALVLFAMLPGAGRARFAVPGVALLLFVAGLWNIGFDGLRTNLQQEQYDFTRAALRTTSPECCVVYPGTWAESIHGIPHYIAKGPVTQVPRARPVADPQALEEARRRCECLYMLRPVFAAREGHDGLWEPFADLPYLEPFAVRSFKTRPSKAYGRYRTPEAEAGVYRVLPK